jgi:hypothetical protein
MLPIARNWRSYLLPGIYDKRRIEFLIVIVVPERVIALLKQIDSCTATAPCNQLISRNNSHFPVVLKHRPPSLNQSINHNWRAIRFVFRANQFLRRGLLSNSRAV